MSANNITRLVQYAAVTFLKSEDLTFITDEDSQIVEGISISDALLPQVVCQCALARANVPFEGNWQAILRVELRSNADDTSQDDHHSNAGELFGKFMTATAETDLSDAIAGFTAQFVVPQEQGWEVNDGSWVSYLTLQIECCGSDIDIS